MFNLKKGFGNFLLILKSRKILSLIGFGLLFLGLIAGLILVRYPQILQKKAAFSEPTLYFNPSNTSFDVGQEKMIEIYLYSGDESISGVDLTLNYENSDLEITKIESGEYLAESVLDSPEINNSAGRARFVYVNTSNNLPSGEFAIARVFIRGKREVSQAKLSFASNYEISKASLAQEYNLIVPNIFSAEGIYNFTNPVVTDCVVVAMIPQENEVSFGQEFDVTIEVRAGSQAVDGVASYINFDQNLLRVISIEPGATLSTILMNDFDNGTGSIDYAAGLLGNTASGTFTLATITFEPIQQVFNTNLVFGIVNPKKTDVTYEGSSVLGNLIETVIVASGASDNCGNEALDEGEVCDWSLSGTSGDNGRVGVREACLDDDGGLDYPTSGRHAVCKNDCSGYYDREECWAKCTGDEQQAINDWGAAVIKLGGSCSSGGIMSDQCACEILSDAVLEFKIGFQGISDSTGSKPEKQVKVSLRQEGEVVEVFEEVSLAANEDGSYTGRISGVELGSYDVLIKSKAFLQNNFGSVSLNAGLNSFDWKEDLLMVGDFIDEGDDYNVLKLADITIMINQFTELEVPVTDENRLFDVVVDGVFRISDIGLVLRNWTDLVIRGDD